MRKHPQHRRRLCALLLCAALTAGPVLAAEAPEETGEDTGYDLTWEELDGRIRSGSINVQVLAENIGSIEAIDYEEMEEQLRSQLNSLADAQWALSLMGDTATANSLEQSYRTLRETFDAVRNGDLQKDNADLVREIENGVDQLVAGGESLYLSLLAMERSLSDGARGLAALDRSLEELRLRRDLGQVSDTQVAELEQTRSSTVSQLQTLEHTISTYKSQLQVLIGEAPTGELALGPIPGPEELEWEEPDYEADLAAAKAASWTLYDAALTLEDAEDTWKDARRQYYGNYYRYHYEVAQHTWNAAQATYAAAVQSFETEFQTLYASLADYQQIWESKEAAVAYQERLLGAAQVRYDLGLSPRSALLTAQDDLAAAQSEAEGAWLDLFTARNSYRQAVELGLL